MPTELAHFIQRTPLCSTHEHLFSEARYTSNPPDILQNLFDNYVEADLIAAGAGQILTQRFGRSLLSVEHQPL